MGTPLDPKVIRAIIRRQLLAAAPSGGPEQGTPEQMLDMVILHLGFDAYASVLDSQGKKIMSDPLGKQGAMLINSYQNIVQAILEGPIQAVIDRPEASRLHAAFMRAQNGTGVPRAKNRAKLFLGLLQFMRTRTSVISDLFPNGKAHTYAVKMTGIATDDTTPVMVLSTLARMPSASGDPRIRKWVREIAEVAGVSVSAIEETVADADTARALGNQLRDVETRLQGADAMSEERASLNETKSDLVEKVEQLAADSRDPASVVAVATEAISAVPVSKVVQEMNLDPEKAAFITSKGKLVLAAGAGSGKTTALVAALKHYTQEERIPPGRIMATTFTKAATLEMKERIEKLGIQGIELGTTHSIAKKIIESFRPAWRAALNNAGNADRIFRMAVEQVKLSGAGTAPSRARPSGGRGRGGFDFDVDAENEVNRLEERFFGRNANEMPVDEEDLQERPADSKKPKSQYWKTPANQWFNLGKSPTDLRGKPIGTRRLKTAVSNFKNSGMTVEQAWTKHQNDEDSKPLYYFAAAAYGAYEWLKANDPRESPCYDFDDWLWKAAEILETDERAARTMQQQFRIVIVDEAQDNNSLQWRMFDVIGAKAEVYAVIGDDKQAIYEFRGAVPQEFTNRAQKGFKVMLLSTNYRSGGNIVEAANKLMAHNGNRQIPMVCRAQSGKETEGVLTCKTPATHQEAARTAAMEIEAALKAGDSPDDFGVIVRNGAEAEAYTMSLASRGIPFRSKSAGKFFDKPVVRGLIGWMQIATLPLDKTVDINNAIKAALPTPGFGLAAGFLDKLAAKAGRRSYLEVLLNNEPVFGDWQDRRVKDFAAAIQRVRGMEGSDTQTLIREILGLKGLNGTIMDMLKDQVNPDDLGEDEIAGVEPTAEELEAAGKAQIRPLLDLAAVERFNANPLMYLDFMLKMRSMNTKSKKGEKDKDRGPAVRVDTCHQWKGLEVKHVYISMAGGVFPNYRTDDLAAAGDETAYDSERRLAYVAITRGKRSVTVMCPRLNYLEKPSEVSRFVSESCIPVEEQKSESKGKTAGDLLFVAEEGEDFDWGEPIDMREALFEE